MQPRSGKGPSWANEPQLQPQTPARKVEGVNPKDNQMDVDPAPSQDALTDLEWMKQRMANSIVQDSGTTPLRPNLQPPSTTDISQVRFLG